MQYRLNCVDDGVWTGHKANSKSWFYFGVRGFTKNTKGKFTVSRVQTLMAVYVSHFLLRIVRLKVTVRFIATVLTLKANGLIGLEFLHKVLWSCGRQANYKWFFNSYLKTNSMRPNSHSHFPTVTLKI